MHAVVRTYSGDGAKKLCDVLEQRTADVQKVLGSIAGLHSYFLIRTADGGMSITVCQDKAGTDESVRRAAEWVKENASGTGANPPVISEGTVFLQF